MKCPLMLKLIYLSELLLAMSTTDSKLLEEETDKVFGPVHDWPKYSSFGQISGVSVDSLGNVYVFHRGNRVWNSTTFTMNNVFADKSKGPIPTETIAVLNPDKGSLIKKTGSNLFYLPHGLTVDSENNIWITDVAMHQVFKFPSLKLRDSNVELEEPVLVLGVKLEPGSDDKHFCKPTGVAIDESTKEFYVSDGYCNSRIIKFDYLGNILLKWGRSSVGFQGQDFYMLQVPHSVALAQDKETLFVADRENFRALAYFSQTGKFKASYAQELRNRVFSVAYSSLQGGLLFALLNGNPNQRMVVIYDVETGKLILSFSPYSNFTNPHDLAVSPDGKFCYVVELEPYKVWKFTLDMDSISQIRSKNSKNVEKMEESKSKNERIEEPIPAESKVEPKKDLEGTTSFLAIGLVTSLIVIGFLMFMFHYYRRKGGHWRYETRRLILDDDETGIRLT